MCEKPVIYYASLTGNVRKFVRKSGLGGVEIRSGIVAMRPYIIVTYTTGFGDIPDGVYEFIESNRKLLRGVAVSGNRNWGDNYGKAGDKIADRYGVPLLHKFELSGTQHDVETFKRKVDEICGISH